MMGEVRMKRKYVHSFARQYLSDRHIQVYNGQNRVLMPIGRIYDIVRPTTKYKIGEKFVEQGNIKRIQRYDELRDMGFTIISESVPTEQKWDYQQRVKYSIKKLDEVIDHLGLIPKGHIAEYDPNNRAMRLVGERAGPLGSGQWFYIDGPKREWDAGKGFEKGQETIRREAKDILQEYKMRWRGEEGDGEEIKIPEVPFMITDSNEIVCMPDTGDMPSIMIVGQKGCQIGTDTVLMSDGTFKQIKDVKEGDRVISPQLDWTQREAAVLGITQWYCEEMYEVVSWVEDVEYTCSYNHLIPIFDPIEKKIKNVSARDLFLKDAVFRTYRKYESYDEEIFVKLRKAEPSMVYGITLDSPSQWYITNDFIVTHNSGKSHLLHSLVSRYFWKPNFKYKIAILNDCTSETGTWCLPNDDLTQIRTLNRLSEGPLPLPCVYFHPLVKEDYEKFYMGDVGFDITIPFKDIVENHQTYLRLKDSSRYFTKIKNKLLGCKNQAEAEEILESMTLQDNIPVQTANKIRAEFEMLFDTKMCDISTEGQERWCVSLNTNMKYNPFTAAIYAGLLPVLETEHISSRPELLAIYFSYIVGDLFMRQKQDVEYLKDNPEVLLVVDEAHEISGTAANRNSGADLLLRRCVREGRPRMIGTLLATQKFTELPDVIKDNTTYLICFRSPGEATKIANQYKLGAHIAAELKQLEKHKCMAFTSEYFIVYDSMGNRRKSRPNEVFVGRSLPPYSLHKRPRE